MKITGVIEIDTDFVKPEDYSKVLDLTLDDVRRELVQLYAEYRTGQEEAA